MGKRFIPGRFGAVIVFLGILVDKTPVLGYWCMQT